MSRTFKIDLSLNYYFINISDCIIYFATRGMNLIESFNLFYLNTFYLLYPFGRISESTSNQYGRKREIRVY